MPNTLTEIQINIATAEEVEGQTTVHCYCHVNGGIRIWPTTFIIDNLGNSYKLLHAFGIPLYPIYMPVNNSVTRFTLIFPTLNNSASSFHIIEQIPETEMGAFYTEVILKNNTGIYLTKILSKN